MSNYGKESKIEIDIQRRGKVEKVTEFVERMQKVYKRVGAALRKAQEEIKQTDKRQKDAEKQNKRDKMILSTKDLVFKKRPARKSMEQYVRLYIIEETISSNTVKLRLVVTTTYPVINDSIGQ